MNTFALAAARLLLLAVGIVVLGARTEAQTQPTVTLTTSATTGISPLTLTLTWTSTGATTCTASGSWTGSKALSGSQTITNLTANASYALTCKEADSPASVSLSWTPPIKNTDGSTLTNLAGWRLSYGSSATVLSQVIQIANPAISSYTVSGLPAGTQYFGVKAYTTTGVESDLSNVASKIVTTVPGQSATKTVPITVDTKPLPPVLTIDTQAYEIRTKADGSLVAARVGLVPLGIACSERQQKVGAVTYSLVPRQSVDMVVWPGNVRLQDVWAKCA